LEVIVAAVIEIVNPEVMEVVPKLISAPDVPQDKSTMRVPPEVTRLPQVAVPLATALALVIVFSVRTPLPALGAIVELSGRVTSRVLPESAVSGFVGCVPVYKSRFPDVPTCEVMLLSWAFFKATANLRLLAMVIPQL
jgi:hypothetical protein